MHFLDSPTLFLLLFWISPAFQIPANFFRLLISSSTLSNSTTSSSQPAAALLPTTTNSITSPSASSVSTPCSPAILSLASGIRSNIAIQNNELAAVLSLGAMLAESPIDSTLFAAGTASLLSFVKQGIAVRENNQRIAPQGNAAVPGLAKVAEAQAMELNLTMTLGVGGVQAERDNATVGMLVGDFRGGIVQNGLNLQAATVNCTIPTGTTAKT